LTGRLAASILFLILAAGCAPPADSAPAISISDFGAQRDNATVETGGPPASFALNLALSNTGNVSGIVKIKIGWEHEVLFDKDVVVEPNSTQTVNFTWSVRTPGKYYLAAVISGEGVVEPQTMTTNVTVIYVPVKNPSPWYTIPCAVLVIIVPAIAIVAGIRWLGRSDQKDKELPD